MVAASEASRIVACGAVDFSRAIRDRIVSSQLRTRGNAGERKIESAVLKESTQLKVKKNDKSRRKGCSVSRRNFVGEVLVAS